VEYLVAVFLLMLGYLVLIDNKNMSHRLWLSVLCLLIVCSYLPTSNLNGQTLPPGIVNVPGTFPSLVGNNTVNAGTTLNVLTDGVVGSNLQGLFGSVVNLAGGTINPPFFSGGVVNVSDGVAYQILMATQSELNVSGGTVVNVSGAGKVNITGGTVTEGLDISNFGSVVNISGGTIEAYFRTFNSVTVNLSGGTLSSLDIGFASQLNIRGDEFLLNGAPLTTTTPSFADADIFTGTLEDGSPFIFNGHELTGVNITEVALPPLNLTPITVNNATAPRGLRAGQELTLEYGGTLGSNFAVVSSTLHINGGFVGRGLETWDSTVNITDGTVQNHFAVREGSVVNMSGGIVGGEGYLGNLDAHAGSEINISGGTVDGSFYAFSGSVVNISGGTVGDEAGFRNFYIQPGSEVNISGGLVRSYEVEAAGVVNMTGGTVDRIFEAYPDSEFNFSGGTVANLFVYGESHVTLSDDAIVNGQLIAYPGSKLRMTGGEVSFIFRVDNESEVDISGGTIGNNFHVLSGGTVNLIGLEFFLNGSPITSLVPGEALAILDRNAVLSGVLADGSPFSYELNTTLTDGMRYFDPNALVTVTLVPEPATILTSFLGAVLLSSWRRTKR
jgi:hypothetical protein